MKLRIKKLAGMAALEARADAAYASLSEPEKAAYDMAVAAQRRPVVAKTVKKPVAPKKPGTNTAKRNFNRSVKQHFSSGRQLSAAHKKAISEGLKRWHAAHGNGNYSGHQRRHAINHINKHIQKKIDHHTGMHAQHREQGLYAKRKKNLHAVDRHRQRAAHHLKMANHLKRAILPLPGKK